MASAVIHSFFSSPCLKLSVESEKSYGKHLSLYNALKVAAQSPGGVAQNEPTLVRDIHQPKLCPLQAIVPRPHHKPACSFRAAAAETFGLQPDRVCEP